jgi:arylsulfatase A-like enzyme
MISCHGHYFSAGTAAILATLSLLGGGCGPQDAGGPPPPSIVLITLDTLRLDHVGAYLSEDSPLAKRKKIPLTRALDKLAARGLVHENAFTTMPTTMPAHASLFTGLHPFEHGVWRNGLRIAPALAGDQLAAQLRGQGYATAAFVSVLPLGRPGSGIEGFEIHRAPSAEQQSGSITVAQAQSWLSKQSRRPLFLWAHLYDPHSPYGRAADKKGHFPVDSRSYGFVEASRFDEDSERASMDALYRKGIRATDLAVERLLATVEKHLGDEVLVVVVADHGETLAERLEERSYAYDHSEFLDEEQIRIPLMLAGPGVEPGRSTGAASIRDLYTTLLAAAGISDPGAATEGRRDLRKPAATRRIVRVEREPLHRRENRVLRRIWAQSLTHEVAVSDGEHTVTLGSDGKVFDADPTAPDDLAEEASAYLAAVRESRQKQDDKAPKMEPAVRRALEALGYLQD